MTHKVTFGAVGRDLYLDLPLSNIVVNHRPQGLIADMLFPVVDVTKQSGAYTEFSQADLLRVVDDKRAPRTEAKRFEIGVSSATYFCNNYALQMGVSIEDRSNADPIYASRLFEGRARILTDKLMLNWENRLALQCTSTSNVGSSTAVASVWTGTGADPLADINTAIDNVTYATGYRPNTILFGLRGWNAFRRHSSVRDIINGTNNGGGYPSLGAVADLLEIEPSRIFVGRGFKNTAEENIARSLTTLWSTNVLIAYVNPNPSPTMDEPSFGYTFRVAAPGIPNMQVERHPYDSRRKVDDVEVGVYQDEKIASSALGFLLTGVTA